jgi:hypothetical protein
MWSWDVLYWAFFSEIFTTRKLKIIMTCKSRCNDWSFSLIFLLLSKDVLDFLNDFDWNFMMKVIMWFFDESIVIISIDMIIFISWFSLSSIMSFKIVVIIASSTKVFNVELKFIKFFSNISIDQTIVFFSAENKFSAKMYFHILRFEIHFVIFARTTQRQMFFSFDVDLEDSSLYFLFFDVFRMLLVNIHRFS